VASLGGLAVFVGLWMEKIGDQDEYKNIGDFKKSKLHLKVGERLVRWGVFSEILLGFFIASWDGWQEIKNNPLNQPIGDISARVLIEVNGTNFDEIDPKHHFSPNVEWVSMMGLVYSGEQPTNTGTTLGAALLVSSSYAPMLSGAPAPNHRAYALRFETLFDLGSEMKAGAASDIDRINLLKIAALFLPTNSEILGGKVTLVINSEIKKEYNIPPQKDFNPKINPFINIGQGIVLIATNASAAEMFKK